MLKIQYLVKLKQIKSVLSLQKKRWLDKSDVLSSSICPEAFMGKKISRMFLKAG